MPFSGAGMRTRVYVDGFNLYYGALKGVIRSDAGDATGGDAT